MRKRIGLGAGSVFVMGVLSLSSSFAATGKSSPLLLPYDEFMAELIHEWKIPGAALAVVRRGRLVFARGYGVKEDGGSEPVMPDSLFRLASLSKPMTALGVMKLVERDVVRLEDSLLSHVADLDGLTPRELDPAMAGITVRQLLNHTAGWDRKKSGDPMFDRQSLGYGGGPHSCINAARYRLRRPLDFTPGERYSYSNLGYCLLGLVIAANSGKGYTRYMREDVLTPMGIRGMKIGVDKRPLPGEVSYHASRGQNPHGFSISAHAANGGWVGSVVDYARFLTAVDGVSRPPDALARSTMEAMFARPLHLSKSTKKVWYGLGFSVKRVPGKGFNWWHSGSLPGSQSLAVRAHDGTLWVIFINHRAADKKALRKAMDQGLWAVKRKIRVWPSHDLFPEFP